MQQKTHFVWCEVVVEEGWVASEAPENRFMEDGERPRKLHCSAN